MSRFSLNISSSFHLPILQLNRGRSTEDANRDAQFSAVRIDLFHHTALILERSIRNLNRFAYFEAYLRLNLIFKLPNLGQHAFDLLRSHRYRTVFCTRKAEHSWRLANKVPGPFYQLVLFVQQIHIYDQVAGKKFSGCFGPFASFGLRNPLCGNQNLIHQVAHFLGFDSTCKIVVNLLLLSGANVNIKPLIFFGLHHIECKLPKELTTSPDLPSPDPRTQYSRSRATSRRQPRRSNRSAL